MKLTVRLSLISFLIAFSASSEVLWKENWLKSSKGVVNSEVFQVFIDTLSQFPKTNALLQEATKKIHANSPQSLQKYFEICLDQDAPPPIYGLMKPPQSSGVRITRSYKEVFENGITPGFSLETWLTRFYQRNLQTLIEQRGGSFEYGSKFQETPSFIEVYFSVTKPKFCISKTLRWEQAVHVFAHELAHFTWIDWSPRDPHRHDSFQSYAMESMMQTGGEVDAFILEGELLSFFKRRDLIRSDLKKFFSDEKGLIGSKDEVAQTLLRKGGNYVERYDVFWPEYLGFRQQTVQDQIQKIDSSVMQAEELVKNGKDEQKAFFQTWLESLERQKKSALENLEELKKLMGFSS